LIFIFYFPQQIKEIKWRNYVLKRWNRDRFMINRS